MNREEAKKLLPVIQAFAEQKKEVQFSQGGEYWQTNNSPSFSECFLWRIKPEPQKIVLVGLANGDLFKTPNGAPVSWNVNYDKDPYYKPLTFVQQIDEEGKE